MRWLIVFLLAFLIFGGLKTALQRVGLGRLPFDFTLRLKGREFFVPLGSSVLLSLIASAVAMLL